MKKRFKYFIVVSIAMILFAACGQRSEKENHNSDREQPLRVVTTFTILQDIAREIGGEDVEIHNLVPTGTAPHEYEPLPIDMKNLQMRISCFIMD